MSSKTIESGTVLIVDDQPANIGVLFEYLKGFGLKVLVAQDGESAIEKAEYTRPDLILLDVMMPGINGFETCLQLKQNSMTKNIPVIFMTALSDTEFTVQGFEVGAVDYLVKPIQKEEVLARVGSQLKIRQYQIELEQKAKVLSENNHRLEEEIYKRHQVEENLQLANERLLKLSRHDGLTGLANRRYLDEYLDQAWKSMLREKTPISVIIIDIDYFKNYNDHYGHQAGDQCIVSVAKVIDSMAKRPADLAARYGGEEFVLLLPNINAEGVKHLGDSLLSAIQALNISHIASSISAHLTVSVGINTLVLTENENSYAFIQRADEALYRAKERGRNCCVVAE